MFHYCTSFQQAGSIIRKTALYLVLYLLTSANGFAKETVVVSLGMQDVVSVQNIARASVANPEVVSAEAYSDSNQVIITGLSIGSTNMTVWLQDGEKELYVVRVVEKEVNAQKELQGLLSNIEGIQVKSTPTGTVISGQVYRGDDLDTLQKALKLYPKVQNQTQVNPQALEYFQQAMTDKLHGEGFDQIQVTRANDTLYLEGFVRTQVEKIRAVKIAHTMYVRTEDHLEMGIEKKNLILVDIKFMEILKTSLNNIGVAWPGSLNVSSNLTLTQNVFSSVLSSESSVMLNGLIQKGDARILANPSLLCQSGFPASFDAGGEIPIKLTSERTASVFFKPYGIHLDINAKSDAGRRAAIEVQSRVSDLDPATAIDGIPGILEHKVNTAVNLDFGQTVAIAGLIESKKSKTTSKMPFFGQIPILGELFKSRNFTNNLSEFVVFLTPILANGDNAYHMQQKNMADHKWNDQGEKLKFSLTD